MTPTRTLEMAGKTGTLRLETGELARQAHSAVLARAGGSAILAAVVGEAQQGQGDFVPLTVDYREKAAASAKIPFGGRGRDQRVQDREVLIARIIDRSVRPLIPAAWRGEIQLSVQTLSIDPAGPDLVGLAVMAAAAALQLSPIPFAGPLAALRLVRRDGVWQESEGAVQRERREADIIVAATASGISMLEAAARELSEADFHAGLAEAMRILGPRCAALAGFDGLSSKYPMPMGMSPSWSEDVQRVLDRGIADVLAAARKEDRKLKLAALFDAEGLAGLASRDRRQAIDHAFEVQLRHALLAGASRLDGRGPLDVRPIEARVGWLSAPHGSALFARGRTQAAVTATLDTPRTHAHDDQSERPGFVLQYNFPAFAVGEARGARGPQRREIGHGALAQRAIESLLPGLDAFPYAIRVESDVLESDGSSSMATVAGASLSLMDAGVPLRAAAAGIAIGLVREGERMILLTDISGEEDQYGDMDFKVAGTARGITAVQLDNKLGALPLDLLRDALDDAKRGRDRVLHAMAEVLAGPRAILADGAPREVMTRVPKDLVGRVIGAKGATIKGIQSESGAEVEIDDDGRVTITARSAIAGAKALSRVRAIAGTVFKGEVHFGEVVSGAEGQRMVRIFDQAVAVLEAASQEVVVGGSVLARILGVDDRGQLRAEVTALA